MMQYRPLGNTGLSVSEIGFGGWVIGGNAHGNSLGPCEDSEALAALNQAYALGCNLFATAPSYGHGHSEAMLGKAIKGWKRDQVVVATKGGQDFATGAVRPNFSDTALSRGLDESLQRLGIETIDLYTLHNPPLEAILHGGVFQTLQRFQAAGKIRFYGVTIHDPQEGIQAIQAGGVQVIEVVYNLFDRRAESAKLFERAGESQVAVLVREPLARGFLSGKMAEDVVFEPGDVRAIWPKPLRAKRVQAANAYREEVPSHYPGLTALALRFALQPDGVSSVLVDFKNHEEVEDAMVAENLAALSESEWQAVHRRYEQIFGVLP